MFTLASYQYSNSDCHMLGHLISCVGVNSSKLKVPFYFYFLFSQVKYLKTYGSCQNHIVDIITDMDVKIFSGPRSWFRHNACRPLSLSSQSSYDASGLNDKIAITNSQWLHDWSAICQLEWSIPFPVFSHGKCMWVQEFLFMPKG